MSSPIRPSQYDRQLADIENTVVIDASGTVSSSINSFGMTLLGIQIPPGFTAGDITFQGSIDRISFYPIYDESGLPLTLQNCAASTNRKINPVWLAGYDMIKIVTSVAQAGSVTLTLALRRVA